MNADDTSKIIIAAYLLTVAILALITNITMVTAICKSASLKAQSNSMLVSLSVNNLLLVIPMLVDICIIFINSDILDGCRWLLFSLQNGITYFCMMNYWVELMTIGLYKCTVLENPSMSLAEKTTLVTKLIIFNWIVVFVCTGMLTPVYILLHQSEELLNAEELQSVLLFNIYDQMQHINSSVADHILLVFMITVLVVTLSLAMVIVTYYYIVKYYHLMGCMVRSNRVLPVTEKNNRSLELSAIGSDQGRGNLLADLSDKQKGSSGRVGRGRVSVYRTISNVYNKMDSVSVETHRPTLLLNTVPVFSLSANSSHIENEITQNINITGYLKPEAKLDIATKCLLYVMGNIIICSTPLLIATVPNMLAGSIYKTVVLSLSKNIFYLNSFTPVVWYLTFPTKLRKTVAYAGKYFIGHLKR